MAEPACISRHTERRDRHSLFFYLLRHLKPNFVGIARNKQTNGLGHVTKRDLISLEVSYPELAEQRKIAHILGTLDDKFELNQRMNKTLDEMARAIFKDWFVDFGPTRAKMEGRTPYLPPKIWNLFPNALDKAGIPISWHKGSLLDLASLNTESWSGKNYPREIEYVDLANKKWGVIETTQHILWKDAPSRARRILRPGDTIVGTVRPGNGAFSFIGRDGLTGSTGFAVLRPNQQSYREFVYLAATSAENMERLSHLVDGMAYPAVRPDIVGTTDTVVPCERVLQAFSAREPLNKSRKPRGA